MLLGFVLGCAVGLIGCAESVESGEGSPADSGSLQDAASDGGVDASARRALSDLSEAEALDACERYRALLSSVSNDEQRQANGCTYFVLGSLLRTGARGQPTFDPADCQQAVDACLERGDGEVSTLSYASYLFGDLIWNVCEPGRLQTRAAGCSTVASGLEACLAATVSELEVSLDKLSCSDPMLATWVYEVGDPGAIPECAAVAAECSQLFEP